MLVRHKLSTGCFRLPVVAEEPRQKFVFPYRNENSCKLRELKGLFPTSPLILQKQRINTLKHVQVHFVDYILFKPHIISLQA